jgi:hypothetical protein
MEEKSGENRYERYRKEYVERGAKISRLEKQSSRSASSSVQVAPIALYLERAQILVRSTETRFAKRPSRHSRLTQPSRFLQYSAMLCPLRVVSGPFWSILAERPPLGGNRTFLVPIPRVSDLMSAFLQSGRSNCWKLCEIKVRFRPEAAVKAVSR